MKIGIKYSLIALAFSCILSFAQASNPPKREKQITYHSNGAIKEKGILRNGKKHGIWWQFYESGVRKSKEKFKRGNRVYLFQYNEKGRLFQIVNAEGKVTEVKDCGC